MKNTFLLLTTLLFLISCSNDEEIIEITTLKVNHYKTTTNGFFFGGLGTVLLVEERNQIGQNNFQPNFDGIVGFEYELGFIYDLKVSKTLLENPPQDASNTRIDLLEVISKTPVSSDTEFKVRLTLNQTDETFDNWVFVNQDNNYSIINSSIHIDCGNLCNELSEKVTNKEQITGVFTHGESDVYILKEILNE
ncbi:DUF4377 domain-containing protein [Aquimarina sp. MMG016]|uniref:DUF4377 domain-containing protein n=1 Tax=Aquimarina sp. MMG016 TaxID=2822690 RepID=UPI001B3A77FA|nr:DUF4377 domain-containing protein [Aquimarina sp. MMG016]MBQ4820331.1 DUF4377 domain-containing protein [Aquimarina sp. MMG016]